MKNTGQLVNQTDDSDIKSAISVGSTASVLLVDAHAETDQPYFAIWIYNDGNQDLWLKPQAASVDNDKKGIPLSAGEYVNIMDFGVNYIGEWSGIMNSGGARDVYVTTW